MKTYLSLILIFLLIPVHLIAQKQALTHIMNTEEQEAMKHYVFSFSETDPPEGEVRNIAEWEDMQAVVVAYTGEFGLPLSSIAEMSEDTNIITIVAGSSEQNTVSNLYANNGVNLSHCSYLYNPPDSYWTRDYSAWFIGIDDEEIAVIDFPYNRPRPQDNETPVLLANALGVTRYGMNLVHTGGNYMCDGYGAAASTDLVWEENPDLSHTEISDKVHDYLGIDNYHVTIDPLDDYIKHIDCWGKFLDVDKVLITQVPESDYRYDDYESVAAYFASQNCSWGYPYQVIRVQAASYYEYDINPYTNSLILNDKVFVPQTGSDLDNFALSVYQDNMPGYEVIGVYSSSWLNSDALHCRTHGVADTEMLFIRHYPLHGSVNYAAHFDIDADVFSYGGSPVQSGFPKLFYREDGGEWTSVLMSPTTGNTYHAEIPAQATGSHSVEYYIYAKNNAGKTKSQPRMGALNPHTFSYNADSAGISEETSGIELLLYPNPTPHFCHVHTGEPGKISLINMQGDILYKSHVGSDSVLDVRNYPPGVYLLKFHNEHGSRTAKIIKR